MKTKVNIVKANIDNLTSLWREVSTPFQAYFSHAGFDYSYLENSEWPNRLWFRKHMTRESIPLIKEKLLSVSSALTIPYWHIAGDDLSQRLESAGFSTQFEQVGMSLKLKRPYKVSGGLKLHLVANKHEALLWSELFKKSFGYTIHSKIVLKSMHKIDYFLAYDQDLAVGTAIAYDTNEVMGVHSVGIPPAMRRKGYAGQIMKLLINSAVKGNYTYMTLQASDMGKHLYLKLGFQEDFLIKNYKLSQP